MEIEDISVLKEDERGIIYDCPPMNYLVRKQGSTSADHTHDDTETLYLIEGEIELTVGVDVQKIKAPKKIFIPGGIHHKLVALTDIKLLYQRA